MGDREARVHTKVCSPRTVIESVLRGHVSVTPCTLAEKSRIVGALMLWFQLELKVVNVLCCDDSCD